MEALVEQVGVGRLQHRKILVDFEAMVDLLVRLFPESWPVGSNRAKMCVGNSLPSDSLRSAGQESSVQERMPGDAKRLRRRAS